MLGEVIELGALEIQNPYNLALGSQRHDQFRACFGVHRKISRIFRDVADPQRLIELRRASYKPDTKGQHDLLVLAFIGTDDKFRMQHTGAFVEEKDREYPVIDSGLHSCGDLMN